MLRNEYGVATAGDAKAKITPGWSTKLFADW